MTTRFTHRYRPATVTRAVFCLTLAAVLLAPTSCAVGPAYHKPPPPNVQGYTAAPVVASIPAAPSSAGAAGRAQTLEYGAAVNPEWWKDFGSPALDQLVARALAHNPDLAAARATLEEARYNLKAAQGVFYPQVELGLSGERTRSSGAAAPVSPGRSFTIFTLARCPSAITRMYSD